MARTRLTVLALITAGAVVGVPFPASASAGVPTTVERAVTVDRALTIRPTTARGVWVERGPFRLPINANMVALSFVSVAPGDVLESGVAIEARFHSASGWSDWQRLWIEPEEGPDAAEAAGASSRVFTAPLWVGTSDQMSLRLVVSPGGPEASDLRLHVINTMGDATSPNLVGRAFGAISRLLRGGARAAEAATVQPGIITRAQWGADESIRECCPRYATSVQMAFVHHTVGTNNYSPSESAALVRGIYSYHVKTRGFADIGYNFLVDRYGQVFEGRYGGMTEPVIGAHVEGFNTGSTGMSLMGDFTQATPPGPMVDALQRLLAWKLDVHHLPPTGQVTVTSGGNEKWPAGTQVVFNRISGHRDGDSTACPGIYAYNLLPSIRNSVNGIGNPKIFTPAINRDVFRPDGDTKDETATISASFDAERNWTATFRDSSGSILRTITGRGSTAAATWDGRKTDGSYPPSGLVTWQLDATDDAGGAALPATGTVGLASMHYDGTPLSTTTQNAWLQSGARQSISTSLVRDSWFRPAEIVKATDVELARYSSGPALAAREGTVFVTPDGIHWIVSQGKKHRFASDSVYSGLGYSASSALAASTADAAAIPSGSDVTDTSAHPSGAVVRSSDGVTWTIEGGTRRRHPTAAVRQSWYRDAEVVTATAADVALPTATSLGYRDGTILRLPDASLWIVAAGVRRWIPTSLYTALGYAPEAPLNVSSSEAGAIGVVGPVPPTSLPRGTSPTPFGAFDSIAFGPGGVSIAGWAIDPNTADPIAVHVYVDGAFATWQQASGSRPDVGAAYPAYGPNHAFAVTIPLAQGLHTVCVYGINVGAGSGNTTIGCKPVSVPDPNPFGSFDWIGYGPGGVSIAGWAIDPNTADPIAVHVYVDGAFATWQQASGSRPDVGAAYPDYGPNHAFTATLPTSSGSHTVCVYAINVGSGSGNPPIGCKPVSVPDPNPFGAFDVISQVPNGVSVAGWAIDPNTADPIAVHFYVDGVFATWKQADGSRPDVGAAYPAYGAQHGYSSALAVSPGTHTVCVYAINAGPGSVNPQLGCKQITVASNPFGAFDWIGAGQGGGASVAGWAIDPNTADPIAVHIYVDGAFAGVQEANASRPDVGRVYPTYGSLHGYSATVSVSPGSHTVCVYAINVGQGTDNPALGCKQVNV